uniref:Multidrug resistance-associated protein 1 n=1 Tax=Timema douglasi TaxID=61478 RepID=A0A7R8Z8Q5_TIMDO|nr:unnamed protein product [Timema douglasi]
MEDDPMDEICGSKFWDSNLTWYTEDPDLTSCFQKTALVWIPCAFLWALVCFEAYYILNSKFRDIPWNKLNRLKIGLSSSLILLAIADLGYAIHQSSTGYDVYPVDYYTPIIKLTTFSLSVALILFNKKRGLRTSGVLFMFWLLLAVCGTVQFRSEIRKIFFDTSTQPVYPIVSYVLYYIITISLLILNCFADEAPTISEYPLTKDSNPEDGASFLSKLFYMWLEPLVWKGFRTPLESKDLWNISPQNCSKVVVPNFDRHWEKALHKTTSIESQTASFRKMSGSVNFSDEKTKPKKITSVLPALWKAYGSTFLSGALLKLLADILAFVCPQLLSLLIQFVEGNGEVWKGYFYAVLMFTGASLDTLVLTQHFHRMYIVGLRIRTALISAIYRKALRMSNNARKESTVGEIVNLMSVDAQRFVEITLFICLLWSAPLQIGVALYFLWGILGPSALAGLGMMIIFIPLNGVIASRVKTIQIRQMKSKDERIKIMNEILNGMKVLKLYGWEPSFEQRILKIRNKEVRVLKQAAYLNAATSFVWTCAPFLVSLASFATFILVDENNVLDAQTAFVSLSLFNIIRMPLAMMPMLIVSLTQVSVSIKRMNKFMNVEELDPNNVDHDQSEKYPLVIESGTFSWGSNEAPILKNINLNLSQGTLVAVVGTVGSGKSSLISTFLGETDKLCGRINTKGNLAYVPQQAWIRNATLKENILFGKPFEKSLYHRVIEACALKPDIEMLPGGDQIEIGEKGINLSGGQKQRVSLARAVYYGADVYFLDDPLSAVDSHVGKHIFDNVLGPSGMLRKKTRVLVTHSVTYLPEVDLIVVLKDGEVTEKGTYKELLEKKGAFADFLMQHLQEIGIENTSSEADGLIGIEDLQEKLTRAISRESGSTGDKISRHGSLKRNLSMDSCDSSSLKQMNSGSLRALYMDKEPEDISLLGEKLIEMEKAETGSVKWEVYVHYMRTFGPILCICTVLFNIIFQGFLVGSNLWLSVWANDLYGAINDTSHKSTQDLYLGVYGALGFGQVVSTFVCDLCPRLGCWLAARVMHNVMLKGVLRAPLTFFDVTPLGRIISRFSKDVDVLDSSLPQQISDCIFCLFEVIATLFVISYSTPIFVSVILPIALLYYFIQRFYVATSRQLKRLESISRSPIFSHFGETVSGATTIRAYGLRQQFEQESEEKVDLNQRCYYPGIVANRWLAVRLEMIGNFIIFFASLFAVLARKTINPGLVGLSVSYSLQIAGTLNWLVRMTSDVETNIVAVERIKEYGEVKQEAPWELPNSNVPSNWPSEGTVEFRAYKVRYREGLDLILKGISFTIKGGEKVGIVGRTGAGKSSLTLGLFRIIEAAEGSILVDGIDIATLGLHTLRSRLTIIPQDPVLFSGSLRQNLDPFDSLPDEQLWRALEHAHLYTFVKGLPAGLNHEISEGGENLSVGQRQLVCLVRALLRKTKVLILDEATAAVDLETDDLIQRTIREEFKDCTVMTIAHRLNTILDSDRVIVLDKGEVIEFDTPEALLQDRNSVFYGMAKDAGLV